MPQDSPPQYRVLVEKDVPMTTRDGLTLRADVYRPDAPGRFPVLLSRLPYNKNLRPRPGDIDYFVERGYGVIMQDTRGRFSSEGEEYYALIWEMADGYDAVEWAAGLPWADGKVGTTGQSYLGQGLVADHKELTIRCGSAACRPLKNRSARLSVRGRVCSSAVERW